MLNNPLNDYCAYVSYTKIKLDPKVPKRKCSFFRKKFSPVPSWLFTVAQLVRAYFGYRSFFFLSNGEKEHRFHSSREAHFPLQGIISLVHLILILLYKKKNACVTAKNDK